MRIVCAGAGYTTIEAAPYIKEKLPQANITVINRRDYHSIYSHTPELLSGSKRFEDIAVNLEQHFKKAGVEFIEGTITAIDKNNKTVHIGDIQVHYDYLLLDLGSEADLNAAPGLDKALNAKGANGMLEIRGHVVTELLKFKHTNKPHHRTFVVAGADVHSIETTAALRTLAETISDQHMIFPDEVSVILVEHEQDNFDNSTLQKLEKILDKKGIQFYRTKLKKFSEDGVELNDRTIETNTLIWTGARRANKLIPSIGIRTDNYGAAVVNKYLQTEDPTIFAAGDNASITKPKTAYLAFDEQKTLADNIIAHASGKKLKAYTPRTNTPVIITTGPGTALLLWGRLKWHGTLPYKIKDWIANSYARRVKRKA